MARVCDICGKGSLPGRIVIRHGLAKKRGGIGLHVTGISKRRFLPNLQSIRCAEKGGVVRRRVCAACIKHGAVKKA